MNDTLTRSCPEEHLLSGYMTGTLAAADRAGIERHVSSCPYCIYRIAEAYEVVNDQKRHGGHFTMFKKINIWALLSLAMFILSFLFPRYFIQFLAAGSLLGIKWIVDNKNTKMLIMIHEAWKHGGEKEAGRVIENIENRMRR